MALRLRSTRVLAIVIFSVLLQGVIGCETVPREVVRVRDGKVYGKTRGLFQGRWYHYYERALSFADGQFWEEAEADLREALRRRDNGDERRARTYGVHFIDYFPHRELGIVLMHQKRNADAIQELESSIQVSPTAKAQFYLDRVRQAWILSRNADRSPPAIAIDSPDDKALSNAGSIHVTGSVRDDTYVQSVQINGTHVRMDRAEPVVFLDVEVIPAEAQNVIVVMATDLAGNTAVVKRTVTVDRQGPVLSIDAPTEGQMISSGGVTLRCDIYDDSGLGEININGQVFTQPPGQEMTVVRFVALAPGENRLRIDASDRAGNHTLAEIPLTLKRSSLPGKLFAPLGPSLLYTAAADPTRAKVVREDDDDQPPEIHLKRWTEEQVVLLDQAYLDGSVRDNEKVKDLTINDRSILRKPGKSVYFNQRVHLAKGKNQYRIEARDASDNLNARTITIIRNISPIRDVGSRMDVALLPFERKGTPGLMGEALDAVFLEAMIESGRFDLKREFRPETAGVSASGTAVPDRQARGAAYLFAGSALERESSLEIFGQILHAQTGHILAVADVYGENLDREALREVSSGLALKLSDEIPLVEGLVIKVKGEKILVDLGKNSRIKAGMGLVIFKDSEPLRHPITGEVIGADEEELGNALVTAVYDRYSLAELIDTNASQIEPLHKVLAH